MEDSEDCFLFPPILLSAMDLKKIELSQWLAIGLVTGILILLVAIGILLSGYSQKTGSFILEFTKNTHEDLNTQLAVILELEASLIEAEPEFADSLQADKDEFELNKEMTISLREELEWISERESKVYAELSTTENNLRAKELLTQEAGLFSLLITSVQLNDVVAQRITMDDKEDMMESIDAILDELQPIAFLSDQTADGLSNETGLDKTLLQNESKKILGEFLEYKKQKFREAEPNSIRQYVEAFKLTGWYFSLQAMAASSGN